MANTPPSASKIIEKAVWQVVNSIPVGQIATYGQIARLAGYPQNARLVGRILSKLPKNTRLPWHRVVNSQGKISNPSPERQLDRLATEGVTPVNGRINLRLYGWDV